MHQINKTRALVAFKWGTILIEAIVILSLFFAPLALSAQQDPGTGLTYECPPKTVVINNKTYVKEGECTFNDLIAAAKNFMDKIIVFTLSFSVIVIAVAGYNYMISGTNPSARKDANRMLTKVAIGIFFILAAWLIVTLIANTLLTDEIKKVIPVNLGN